VSFTLEIAVESTRSALTAELAGADRIELCADLSVGGLTPSEQIMSEARASVGIPIFVIIRPRAGNFVYNREEFAKMLSQIALARQSRMNGVVSGILTPANTVDTRRMCELVEAASPLPVTFHRAFDATPHLAKSLEDVIATGARRVLSSGGAVNALQGKETLRDLVQAGRSRIIVMPGSGITSENFPVLRRTTSAKEFHTGLGSILPYGISDFERFAAEIRNIVAEKRK
jgi:copper homeostasis protein